MFCVVTSQWASPIGICISGWDLNHNNVRHSWRFQVRVLHLCLKKKNVVNDYPCIFDNSALWTFMCKWFSSLCYTVRLLVVRWWRTVEWSLHWTADFNRGSQNTYLWETQWITKKKILFYLRLQKKKNFSALVLISSSRRSHVLH